jgi:TPR repeat protein
VVSPGAAGGFLSWLRAELLAPTCALAVFLVVRLSLGGAGGSQTIGEYVRDFVGNRSFDLPRLLHGAWAGLRVAWLPLLLLPFLLWHAGSGRPWRRAFAAALPALVALTLGIALGTALDLSRSMVLLLPAAVLAWLTASETDAWRRYRLAPLLGIGALALPASHVVSRFVLPVDAFWRPPLSVADALNHLGNAFRTGTGVAQSAVRAVHCFERAAAAGLPAAMANLGFMHAGGHGVPKNRDVALQWYRRAAQRDSFEGQSLLALAYFHGDGVTADPVLARHWFDRAAAQGHAPAETNLATMLLGGLGGPQDAAGAIRWYRRAAAKGEARSAAALGDIYSSGQAVPVDTPRALAWLEVAARLGHADGMGNIGVIFINGSGVAVDRVEALAWFALATNRGSARFAAYRDRLRGELGTAELAAAEARAHAIAVRLAHSDPAQRIFRSDSEPAR